MMEKKKPTYTKKMHRYRLRMALETRGDCNFCTASRGFSTNRDYSEMWDNDPCEICGIEISGNIYSCPCIVLGKNEALKRAWEEVMKDDD